MVNFIMHDAQTSRSTLLPPLRQAIMDLLEVGNENRERGSPNNADTADPQNDQIKRLGFEIIGFQEQITLEEGGIFSQASVHL